ncbi:MAG TPA: O-antigen ligase family protein [Caulobacter sp.]|nr:O-antigen ligase family protein [Caulobacter sp.]
MPAERRHRHHSRWPARALFAASAVLLALCLLLGGASRLNGLQLTVLELASLPLLGWAVWRATLDGLWPRLKAPALLLAGLLVIAAIQLVPLPPELWSRLPGHGASAEALRLAGLEIGWRPLSLTPDLTVGSLLALLPAVAIFLAAVLLRPSQQAWLAAGVVAFALVSLGLGAVQLVDGKDSAFFLYPFANRDNAVGLFANRNHQAALLVTALPFAAAAVAVARARGLPSMPLWVALAAVFLLIVPFVVLLKSRAGVLLLAPSLIASLAILWPPKALAGGGQGPSRRGLLALGGVIALGLLIGGALAFGPLVERFAANEEGRLLSGPVAARAAWDLMPFGSGLGSFKDVYAGVEPLEIMAASYWLHAHNDYLELWLEAGVPALALILLFLVWWARAGFEAWRAPAESAQTLARAGAAVVGLLLIHSLVDYPLRTPAMAAVFALACGLMASGARGSGRS